MKVCIVGAGAIGGLLGARLAQAGEVNLSVVARGATLAALQAHGWRLETAAGLVQAPAHAVAEPAELGVQDWVILAVKGQALPALAPRLAPLLGPQTVVLPAINGVPWWFCQGQPGLGNAALESVDPGGEIAAVIAFEQVLGCVVHMSATALAPGLVRHVRGLGLILGEPEGGHSERVERLHGVLARAGFEPTVSAQIRQDIWYKLWGNLTMNPLSALTGATVDQLLADPLVRAFCSAAMREAAQVGERIGCPISQTPEDRHAITAQLGAFKTSMLQDVEAGRSIELDGIVGSVREIAQGLGLATPNIDALLGLARVFGRQRGLYPTGS